jgi:hypothetical protein
MDGQRWDLGRGGVAKYRLQEQGCGSLTLASEPISAHALFKLESLLGKVRLDQILLGPSKRFH